MAKTTTVKTINHVLVPKHTMLSDKEKETVLKQHEIVVGQLPKILTSDPAIAEMNPKIGDIVKIERPSYTMGKTVVYRVVVNG
ncbi:MAG: DNA-directed RNA polymerase subunit H [Candidatus Woesearchaeota archaeon]|jgi:DNA-directed RNA polymerase subunit H